MTNPRNVFTSLLCALVGALAFTATPALATPPTGFASTSFAPAAGFAGPVGLALNSSGDVYVVDQGNDGVDEFSASGSAVLAEVALPGGAQPNQLTVDGFLGSLDEGDVFVAGFGNGVIYRFASGLTGGVEVKSGLSQPTGVAVDKAGDFFVSLVSGAVLEFNGNWEPVNAAGTVVGATANTVVEGPGGAQTLAVDPAGDVYLATGAGTIRFKLTAGAYGAGETFDAAGSNGVTVAPSGRVYVDQGNQVAEYEPSGSLLHETIGAGVLSGAAYGVGVNAAGLVYVADNANRLGYIFEEGLRPEKPVTGAAVVSGASVTLHGTLEPAKTKLSYYFEYNTGPSCTGGSQTPVEAGEEAVKSKALTLEPSTGYTVCLIAENKYGLSEPGKEVPFTTGAAPPTVESESFSGVNAGGVHLEATLNPNNETTECHFQYGTDPTLTAGTTTELCSPASFPASFGGQGVSLAVGGLAENTTYYYRVLATNTTGTEPGTIEHFTTDFHPETPESKPPNPIAVGEATLQGVLNPGSDRSSESPPGGVTFRYRQSASECQGENEHTVGPKTPPLGHKAESVEAEVTELLPGTQYTYCLISTNNAGEASAPSTPVTFTTPTVPTTVTGELPSEVSTTGATLSATIDPGGAALAYYVEYGSSEPYIKTAPVSLDASATAVPVQVKLSGLEPGVEYHYRFLAGATPGALETFTTTPVTTASAAALPDNRAYEMVSPVADEDSSVFEPLSFYGNPHSNFGDWTSRPFQVSADGAAVVYLSTPTATGGGRSAPEGGQENIARREGGGWREETIQPAGLEIPSYQGFSSDLSAGVIESSEPLSAGVPETYGVLYARTLSEAAYRPLFTATPPHRTTGQFGARLVWLNGESAGERPVYAGGSADMSHLLFEANDALTASAFENPFTLGEEENDLYESVDGQLQLVNVSSEGKPVPNATFGSQYSTKEEGGDALQPDFSNAISADGSRVFWTALEYIPRFFGPEDAGSKALYMREDGTRTVQLDAPELGASGVGGGGRFWTATPDGSKVFFTDESRLTEDSTAEPGKPDLYECELPQAGGSCTLSDLTANQGEAANVKGVIGTSENGEYVYFVAEGVLAGNENANHEKAEPQACVDSGGEKQGIESRSQCNLYVWHRGAVPRFIARLSGEDNEQTVSQYDSGGTAYGDWQSDLGLRTAQVAPNGSTLAFMSQRSLTGYPSEGWDQVYVYDFDSGGLSCASCNPTGTPAAASASLPISFNDTHALRDVSEDGGRVFFLSSEQVVPQASSGQPDVYEWERNGEGSCATAGGCVYLLSGATSPEQSYFLDASANGNDVFIITRAQLLPQDQNELWDVYDARVDAPVPVAPPTCTGTGCQGIPGAPPIFATPSSVTFNGVGNFPPGGRASSPVVVKPKTKTVKCAKGKKLSHGKCIKRKKSKKTKKASNYGRAK